MNPKRARTAFYLKWRNQNMAARAGIKLVAGRNAARAVEKEWAVPAAEAGEDRQEDSENVRHAQEREKPASTHQNKAATSASRDDADNLSALLNARRRGCILT